MQAAVEKIFDSLSGILEILLEIVVFIGIHYAGYYIFFAKNTGKFTDCVVKVNAILFPIALISLIILMIFHK